MSARYSEKPGPCLPSGADLETGGHSGHHWTPRSQGTALFLLATALSATKVAGPRMPPLRLFCSLAPGLAAGAALQLHRPRRRRHVLHLLLLPVAQPARLVLLPPRRRAKLPALPACTPEFISCEPSVILKASGMQRLHLHVVQLVSRHMRVGSWAFGNASL
jgi:hypothetical protein